MTNQKGSMVISIMIVSVAILMAAMAGLSLITRSQTSANTAQVSSDLSFLSAEIGAMLLRENSCRRALGGPAAYGQGSGSQTYDPTAASNNIQIFKSDGTTILYQGAGGSTPPTTAMCTTSADPTCTEVFGHPQAIIRSIELRPVRVIDAATRTYWATLAITAFKPSAGGVYQGLEGAPIIANDDLKLSVQVDALNKIISCSSLSFLGSDRTPLPVCVPGYALYSNGFQVRCVKTICQSGETRTGYLPNGDACCKVGGVGPCVLP